MRSRHSTRCSSVRWLLPAVLLAAALSPALAADRQSDLAFGPYANKVTQTTASVLWVSHGSVPVACSVEAAEGGAGDERVVELLSERVEDQSDFIHTAKLAGLEPGRTYRYSVECGADEAHGSFRTAPVKGSDEPLRFVVYGDTRSYPERHRTVMEAMSEHLPFAFLVNTGDLVSNGTVWSQWGREYFGPAASVLSHTSVWPVRGNHEQDAVLYRKLFDLPHNEFYYSFDFGNVHVVGLDQYRTDSSAYLTVEERAEMAEWLDRDLAQSDAEWTVVACHAPIFNVGGHGSDWGQEDILPILEEHGVDIVVSGHSHIYERFRPIGPPGGKPIIHVVTGGGGAPTYDTAPSPILASAHSRLHFCVFEVDGDQLNMQAIAPDGEVLDSLRLVHTGGAYQPEVMAEAVPTEAARSLTKVFKSQTIDVEAVPSPDDFGEVVLPAGAFPIGARVEMDTVRKPLLGGGDYILFWNDEGHWLEWQAHAQVAGSYTVELVYATQSNSPRELRVNGQVVPGLESFELPITGGWREWRVARLPATVQLRRGRNVLRLTSVGGEGFNLNAVKLTGPGGREIVLPAAEFGGQGGGEVRVSNDAPWRVRPVSVVAGSQPISLFVSPPRRAVLGTDLGFVPQLSVRMRLECIGEEHSAESVPFFMPAECVRELRSPGEPAVVRRAERPITVDGRSGDWSSAARLALPSTGEASDVLWLAWSDEGLYGVASVRDDRIEVNAAEPWRADCVEINLEPDFGRASRRNYNRDASKLLLYPRAHGTGEAGAQVLYGRYDAGAVTAVARRTPEGYTLEFLIPSSALAPYAPQPGMTMGFHYALWDDGAVREQFADAEGVESTWSSPIYWGAIRIAQ